MSFAIEPSNRMDHEPATASGGMEPDRAEQVNAELERILASPYFRNALRCRQFLEFVVRHAIQGQSGQLKERTIGTEVFHRDPGYATGDDPVVRVQAGEVRRRLQQYYQQAGGESPVRIELPVGSYVPQMRWMPAGEPAEEARAETQQERVEAAAQASPPDTVHGPVPVSVQGPRRYLWWVAMAACVAAGMLAGFRLQSARPGVHVTTLAEQFWAPAFATKQPVLICVAKPVVYRPGMDLYERYARNHPGKFKTEVERSNEVLPLPGNEKVQWDQIVAYPDYGVAVGDAYAAVGISGLLGEMGKPSQVRIGGNYSFEDLRNSPDVIIGAFNNKWTMEMTAPLHFAFVEGPGTNAIREQVEPGREWHANLRDAERFGEDYAIVARLLDSKTGQFTVIAAGLASSGTQAAGEFVSSPEFLDKGLRGLPTEWQKKNLELVLKTMVTDSTPEPPQVVAAYSW